MCKCTPEIRTPWCGKPGCEIPGQFDLGKTKRQPTCPSCGSTYNGIGKCICDLQAEEKRNDNKLIEGLSDLDIARGLSNCNEIQYIPEQNKNDKQLTKLEQFALAAMHGMCANPDVTAPTYNGSRHEVIAKTAYDLAEKMLEESEKRKK